MSTSIKFTAIPTAHAQKWWREGKDDYGNPLERTISEGNAPCRHCLCNTKKGEAILLGAYKPFAGQGAFAETGPISICAQPCTRYENEGDSLPPVLAERELIIMRGYSADEKIDYTTGNIVNIPDLEQTAQSIFQDPDVAFIHLRSAGYTCFTTRIDRAD